MLIFYLRTEEKHFLNFYFEFSFTMQVLKEKKTKPASDFVRNDISLVKYLNSATLLIERQHLCAQIKNGFFFLFRQFNAKTHFVFSCISELTISTKRVI